MIKCLFACILLCFSSEQSFCAPNIERVSLHLCQQEDLSACQEIFVEAFMKAYEEFSCEQLGIEDKRVFLTNAFADVYDDLRHGQQTLVVAKREGKIVGFAGFKPTEVPRQLYITQLAVDPACWNQGIGRQLVFSALDLYHDVSSLALIVRKINSVAQGFYLKLGFHVSEYMHAGYNPERYIGYEWVRPAQEISE